MPYLDHEKIFSWETRAQYIMALLCQTIGTTTFLSLPQAAINFGASGYIIGYLLTYAFVGIPLLYMEFIVSQFTARDCIQVWRICPCLSHIGYFLVLWQIINIIYNHTIVSFIIHYFLISFENPVPYYDCGKWSTKDCNILKRNYTVNQECIKFYDGQEYCDHLYETYPEYQYWRYHILGTKLGHYYVAWRVCLASALACCFMFINCFKRKTSLKWFLRFLTIYPVAGYTMLLIGSMMQKGVVTSFDDAVDADFSRFVKDLRVYKIIKHVLYTLNIGTGLSFNLGASTSFRAPCYSNVVVTVAICAVFSIIAICTITMMSCPFADSLGIKPSVFTEYQISLVFEKIPLFLKQYEYSCFWLILSFSCNAILALSTNVIIFQHLLEMLSERYVLVHRYPGLICFAFLIVTFIITTPLLGYRGVYTIFAIKKKVNLVAIFITMIECLVFVMWYGLEKFSEDVHFMQGIQPKSYMKFAWLASFCVVSYVFISELSGYYSQEKPRDMPDDLGLWILMTLLGLIIMITLLRLAVATLKKQFREVIKVDPSWGPRSEVLLRSRAMFTAQAMTKEYIYRQYHLQAGIQARQRTSNIRRPYNE